MAALANLKHETFCQEYIVDYNGTQAAIRAGYSKKTAGVQASKLLKNANILARIRELQEERMAQLSLDQNFVVLQIVDTIQQCKGGYPVKTLNPKTGKYEEIGMYQFDSRGTLKGLELLGTHLGMFGKVPPAAGGGEKNNLLEQIIASTAEDIDTDDIPEIQ